MKSHVRENIAKNAVMRGITLSPREDGDADANLSALAWEIVETIADNVNISNIVFTKDKIWKADGEYHGKRYSSESKDLGELIVSIRDNLKKED